MWNGASRLHNLKMQLFHFSREYMKLIKIILAFVVVILLFASCETTRNKTLHNNEIRTELKKYADVLNLKQTKIYFSGSGYSLVYNGPTSISLNLYLKSVPDNRETVISIRDELIDYFNAITWKIGGERGFYQMLQISFWLKENGKNVLFHNLLRYDSDNVWSEWWRGDPPGFGKPLARKNINNEKLNTLLNKNAEWINIERSEVFYSDSNTIQMYLFISDSDNRENQIDLKNDLIKFFPDNQHELINEDNDFDTIYIAFFRITDGNLLHSMAYQEGEWDISWDRY